MFENLRIALKRIKKLNRGEALVFFRVPIINSPPPDRYHDHYGFWKEQSEMTMKDWNAILEGTREIMDRSYFRSVRDTDYSHRPKSM